MARAKRDRQYLLAPRAFTAEGRSCIEPAMIVIEGSRIAEVRQSEVPPAGVRPDSVRRYPGATLLPGLIDAHAHITLSADGRSYEAMERDPDEMMAIVAVRNMQRHLTSGVTTLRDNGCRNRVTFVVREAVRRGYLVGPRLLLSGRPLTHRHGHFHWCNGVADGADEIRAVVRELVAEGADHIKIMASGGGTFGNMPYYASYNADELKVAVEVAHSLGRLTTAHCRSTDSMENALAAGLDCIEHAEFLVPSAVYDPDTPMNARGEMRYDPALTERILASNMFVSFTMQAGGYDELLLLRSRRDIGSLSDPEVSRLSSLEGYFERKIDLFARLLADGVLERLIISTDAGPFSVSFGNLHYGVELAVAGGMSTVDALLSITARAAKACGVSSFLGTLSVGKQADVVVVSGDPTANISALSDVEAVYLGGTELGPDMTTLGIAT